MVGKTEDQVKASCYRYLKKNGWDPVTIYTGGIPGPGKMRLPNPAKGIPDCIAFHYGSKKVVWIEFKREIGGKVSDDQNKWHFKLVYCGQKIIVVNSLKSLKEQLDET